MIAIPTAWIVQADLPPDGWFAEHAPNLVRVWPDAERVIAEAAGLCGVSWKLPTQRMAIEQSALAYGWDGSDRTYYGDLAPPGLADALIQQGVLISETPSTWDDLKLYYLCGADKTDAGPRPDGWFGPKKQVYGCIARFKWLYRGEQVPADILKITGPIPTALRGLGESDLYKPGVPVSRGGVTITPDNQATADSLRYTSSMAAPEKLRTIGQRYWPADFEVEEPMSNEIALPWVEKTYNFRYTRTKRAATHGLIVHHSAGAASTTAEQIHTMHRNRVENGKYWSGIGYHAVIYPDGTLVRGREEWARGGHAGNANDWALGVCLPGDFTNTQPTDAQVNTLALLLAAWKVKYDWSWDSKKTCSGHRDWMSTSCPGKAFYPRLPEVVALAKRIESGATIPPVTDAEDPEPNVDTAPSGEPSDMRDLLMGMEITDGTRGNDPATRSEVWTMLGRAVKALKQ